MKAAVPGALSAFEAHLLASHKMAITYQAP
jgi:hypothetical protein